MSVDVGFCGVNQHPWPVVDWRTDDGSVWPWWRFTASWTPLSLLGSHRFLTELYCGEQPVHTVYAAWRSDGRRNEWITITLKGTCQPERSGTKMIDISHRNELFNRALVGTYLPGVGIVEWVSFCAAAEEMGGGILYNRVEWMNASFIWKVAPNWVVLGHKWSLGNWMRWLWVICQWIDSGLMRLWK